MEEEKKKSRVIKNARDARWLLKRGHKIIDIKPKKENPVETVFVFEADEAFYKDFNSIGIDNKKEKE
jgi:hypothetical protein